MTGSQQITQVIRKQKSSPDTHKLAHQFMEVRGQTERLCSPLSTEDYVIQSMEDASPTKWHLAHTTWFFETFILQEWIPRTGKTYKPFHPQFSFLFNSYYNAVGNRHPRSQRGLLSRPTVKEVYQYRGYVDTHMQELLRRLDGPRGGSEKQQDDAQLRKLILLGLNHEQQHQELLLTDIKHALSCNPLFPVYNTNSCQQEAPEYKREADEERRQSLANSGTPALPMRWLYYVGGLQRIGHDEDRFSYDNETPRHQVFVAPFQLASRPITNREYLAFLEDGGYRRCDLWLSDGWATCQAQGWEAPLYWQRSPGHPGEWWHFTLSGLRPLDLDAPVCHVSYYEADAYARWADARLPTEFEWESATRNLKEDCLLPNFLEDGHLHPIPAQEEQPREAVGGRLWAVGRQEDPAAAAGPRAGGRPSCVPPANSLQPTALLGDVWEWTASPYTAYPGYRPQSGALGEYNGKFMINQMVLRGGSCASPRTHIRTTYRNFFPPNARWQFSGIRLAKDA